MACLVCCVQEGCFILPFKLPATGHRQVNKHTLSSKPTGKLCLLLALLFCVLFSATGCNSNAPAPPSVIMAAPPAEGTASLPDNSSAASLPEPLPDEPIALTMVTGNLSSTYTGSENGAYTIASYEDGSSDIFYFDYDALAMTRLDQPEKAGELPLGHLPDSIGGITPVYAGGNLFLFRLGGTASLVAAEGKAGQAAILRTGPDGSGLVTQIMPDNWTFLLQSAILTDGTALYFIVEETGEAKAFLLVRMDMQTMECQPLHRFEDGFDYSLEGNWEMGPVLLKASPLPPINDPAFNESWKNQGFTLFALGMNTGEVRNLFSYGQGTAVSVQHDTIYYWQADDNSVRSINTNTGEEATLAGGFAPKGYVQAVFSRQLLDGKLPIQFATTRQIRHFAVDTTTGEVMETPIERLGDNITVFAEAPNAFFVRSGQSWVAKDKIPYSLVPGAEVSPTTEGWISMPEYALIAKADYWAGRANFIVIKDLVFE